MDRDTDVINMKVSINDGVQAEENPQLKAGAKDSLSGANTTEAFAPSASVKSVIGGKWGGEKVV